MTEPERKEARARINEARRQQIELLPLCAHCGAPFERTNPKRIYCTPKHKQLAWLRTDGGRRFNRERSRRRRARLAEAGCLSVAGVRESVAA